MVIEVPSLDRWEVLGGVLGNRKGECLSGTWFVEVYLPSIPPCNECLCLFLIYRGVSVSIQKDHDTASI